MNLWVIDISLKSVGWFVVGLWFAYVFWKFFDWDERQEKKMKQDVIDDFLRNKRRAS